MAENVTAGVFASKTLLADWTRHAVTVLIGVAMVIGIPANILVVLVHIRIIGKTITDWMIFYIAVCDIMALLIGPMFIFQVQGFSGYIYPLSSVVCKLYYMDSNSVSMAAYMFCACTALERYHKVVLSKEIFTYNQARFIWVPIVLISFGFGSLMFWAVKAADNGVCKYNINRRSLVITEYILITLITVISSLVMALCYIWVGIFLLGKMKQILQSENSDSFMSSYKNTIQTTKMLAIITVVFFLSSNVPYGLGIFIAINSPPKTEPEKGTVYFLTTISFVNNFFNPILYMIMSSTFRQRSIDVLRSCFTGCKASGQTLSRESRYNLTEKT